MNTSIVLTVIADDQPGIIQAVSTVLTNHGGNWTQSSMSTLAGQFAGILLVSMPEEKARACIAELRGLEAQGLGITVKRSSETDSTGKASAWTLKLVGNDRPGIVHEITTLLAAHKISVHDLETKVEGASMGGGALFKANVQLVVPGAVDIDALEVELEDLANDLMVDITFGHQ